jgi:hypothetical protein
MTLKQNFIRNAQKVLSFQKVVNVTYRREIYQHYSFNAHFLLHLERYLTQNTLNFVHPFYLCVSYDS